MGKEGEELQSLVEPVDMKIDKWKFCVKTRKSGGKRSFYYWSIICFEGKLEVEEELWGRADKRGEGPQNGRDWSTCWSAKICIMRQENKSLRSSEEIFWLEFGKNKFWWIGEFDLKIPCFGKSYRMMRCWKYTWLKGSGWVKIGRRCRNVWLRIILAVKIVKITRFWNNTPRK